MSETVYYDVAGAQVTSSRFIVGNQSFPIGQLTSVRLTKVEPKRGCSTAMLIGGCILAVIFIFAGLEGGSSGGILFGVFCVFIAFLGWLLNKQSSETYTVQITTASGEQKLLASKDRSVPEAIIAALNQAIVDRESH